MKYLRYLFVLFCINTISAQDTIIPLWPKVKIPNNKRSNQKEVRKMDGILRISKVQEPTIEVFLPSKSNATGEAVLIFPGGGYSILAYDWEGTDIAKYLNGKGIAAMVVKYRLPSNFLQTVRHNVPLIDAQRAIRLVRSKYYEFNIAPKKIGVLGFSAGGHLASTLGTQYDREVYGPQDAVDKLSARPDFMALAYPVIVFGEEITHQGSQYNLIGENANETLVERFSNEKHVTGDTPPTFLIHAMDDRAVPVENSLQFYKALKDKDVETTMHLYPKGGHGFSLALRDDHLKGWPELLVNWIKNLE